MENRDNIYYWKCDRPNALDILGKKQIKPDSDSTERLLLNVMKTVIGNDIVLTSANGQGNHLTYLAYNSDKTYFIRVDDESGNDPYMFVESHITQLARQLGIPVPAIHHCDVSRTEVPFAYQIMEHIPFPDLNSLFKSKNLDLNNIANQIGRYLATWQTIRTPGFGPFDACHLKKNAKLQGLHSSYADYFFLNLNTHIQFLVNRNFLKAHEADYLLLLIVENERFLTLNEGCLVHKDLALWNILGDSTDIKAIIDWDDTIVGDPTDDLSLLACFHSEQTIEAALTGYESVRPLPMHFTSSFYLHLLRNMIVKAVIRIAGNYFNKTADFFLIDQASGDSLEDVTKEKIFLACKMLKSKSKKIEL